MKRIQKRMVILVTALIGFGFSVYGEDFKTADEALSKAKAESRYLFMIFYEKQDDKLSAMEKEVELFRKKKAAGAMVYKADIKDKKDMETVNKFEAGKVDMPAVLVFAPNGSITGGFPEKVTEEQLEGTIVSVLDMKIMKTLQEGKIALVLIQNDKTKLNKESSASAEEFKNDPAVKDLVDIIKADPAVIENKKFMKACKIADNTEEAVLAVLVPSGAVAGTFKGKVEKSVIFSSLRGGTCSPGGSCAPGCVE
jgi:hypothetical protein